MMTLTWNYPNELAFPNLISEEAPESLDAGGGVQRGFPVFDNTNGLTKKGFLFVERMEELGMIVDVSHLSDKGFWDIVKNTRKPFVASHSNARSLCGHARNLTDDMIRAVADRGGVIGLNYYGCFLNERNDSHSTVSRMAAHARHIINVGGQGALVLARTLTALAANLRYRTVPRCISLWRNLSGSISRRGRLRTFCTAMCCGYIGSFCEKPDDVDPRVTESHRSLRHASMRFAAYSQKGHRQAFLISLGS